MVIVWYLLIGITAGWAAARIMRGGGFGLLGNMLIGTLGALLGGMAFGLAGVPAESWWGSLVTAILGAAAILYLAGLFRRV